MKVEKIDNISPRDFYENFIKPGIPAVLKNASKSWKDNSIFTPAYFGENFGDRVTSHKGQNYTMSEVLDLTRSSTAEDPAPYPILYEIPTQLPEFLNAVSPIHMGYSRPNWFRSNLLPYGKYGNSIYLFIGGKGNSFVLHKDTYHTNAWITQLYGEKDFLVFPRDQEAYLYPSSTDPRDLHNFISPIDILNPDYDKYPDFRHATSLRVTVFPGETMFVPNGIWHTTVSNTQNISLIFDQLNASNFKAWSKDIYNYSFPGSKLKANLKYAASHILGTMCKIGEPFSKY